MLVFASLSLLEALQWIKLTVLVDRSNLVEVSASPEMVILLERSTFWMLDTFNDEQYLHLLILRVQEISPRPTIFIQDINRSFVSISQFMVLGKV